nr:hypothetical protein [Tanacetum cinerariifolium]
MNKSKSTFDPYRYMEEMQMGKPRAPGALTISEYVETDDDDFQEQKSFQESVLAEQESVSSCGSRSSLSTTR